ncbi:MAG: T9SS type A sorting domain-containing protein [Ignavibacterium sp.]
MKTTITAIIIMLIGTTIAQTVYEVQPGTKGNEIKLTVTNVSEENSAHNVKVVLTRKSSALSFKKETETIEMIEAKAEAEAKFMFDINRNAPINHKDTIEFMITSSDGIMMMKQFIFSYTGPKEYKLEQNYPNPFNPKTKIRYSIASTPLSLGEGLGVRLIVYDILGNEVTTLVNEEKEPGYYEVEFNAEGLSSGIYFYRLQSDNTSISTGQSYTQTRKMILLR